MTRTGYRLTAEAENDRADFVNEHGFDGNCSCHLSPPCGSCMHPGNPMQQAEDDTAWEPDPDELLPSLPQLPEQAGVIELPRDEESAKSGTSALWRGTTATSVWLDELPADAKLVPMEFGRIEGFRFVVDPYVDPARPKPVALMLPAWRGWMQRALDDRTAEAIELIVDRWMDGHA